MQNPPRDEQESNWASLEDVRLIELWRLHCPDFVEFHTQLPIYRKIAEEMRRHGYDMNPQDCRRRMNILYQKYSQERSKLPADDADIFAIDWTPFPLIHEIYRRKSEEVDLGIVEKEVNAFLATLPPSESEIEHIVEAVPASSSPPTKSGPPSLKSGHPPTKSGPPATKTGPSPSKSGPPFAPFKVTPERLKRIRDEIKLLEHERNDSLHRLSLETAEFAMLQKMFENWQRQHQELLQACQS